MNKAAPSADAPSLEALYAKNGPLLRTFCQAVSEQYGVSGKPAFSRCTWMPGWNIQFKKSGRSLCTVYPGEESLTVLVVIGKREKEAAQALLPDCCAQMQAIYAETREGNGQRWLMVPLAEYGALYEDTLRLIALRMGSR